MTLIKKTSIFSDSRFPSYIRGNPEFDMLRQFVKSYFESLEEIKQANYELLYAQENSDVDTVTSEFLDKFYKTLCPDMPAEIMADKKLLLKHSKELYQKKGTPDSFKLLFKILYNETVKISYPSENILRASDGKWNQESAIHVILPVVTDQDVLNLVGKEIITINKFGIIRNVVIQIKKLEDSNIYEIVIDKQKNIRFNYGDSITINGFKGTIVGSTQSVTILKEGKNFKIGQLIKLDNEEGKGSIAKITDVTPSGGIKSLKLVKFGAGYSSDFNLTVNPSVKGTPESTSSFDRGFLPIKESTEGYKESGVVSKVGTYGNTRDYFMEEYMTGDYISTPYSSFTGITTSGKSGEDDQYAIFTVKIDAVLTYPGFWSNNNGSLSNPLICLQDNHLYQNFSYMIQSPIAKNEYESVVKKLLHPAGMVMFNDMLLENNLDLSSNISDASGLFVDVFINDIIDAPDVPSIDVTSYHEDTFTQSDYINKNLSTKIEDIVTPTQISSYFSDDYALDYAEIVYYSAFKTINQQKSDTVFIDENIGKNFLTDKTELFALTDAAPYISHNRKISDLVYVDSSTTLSSTNSLNDNFSLSDSGNNLVVATTIRKSDTVSNTDSINKTTPVLIADTVTIQDSAKLNIKTYATDLITTEEVAPYSQQSYADQSYFENPVNGVVIKIN